MKISNFQHLDQYNTTSAATNVLYKFLDSKHKLLVKFGNKIHIFPPVKVLPYPYSPELRLTGEKMKIKKPKKPKKYAQVNINSAYW